MLLNLYIHDFGIIEQTELNFSAGLNVLSGETGAGKSIIIEAIQVATGGRGSAEFVRSGCERAIVQATVETPSPPDLLVSHGIARYKSTFRDSMTSSCSLCLRGSYTCWTPPADRNF